MFSNSQNNIFTDDMEFALGASSCLEFNGPNDRAMLPNLMEDYEEKFSAEERLRKDKEIVLSNMNSQYIDSPTICESKDFSSTIMDDFFFDQDFSPSPADDDFDAREELIKDIDDFLDKLDSNQSKENAHLVCPLENMEFDAEEKQLAEDFIDQLFQSTLEEEKNSLLMLDSNHLAITSEVKEDDFTEDTSEIVINDTPICGIEENEEITVILIEDNIEATIIDMDVTDHSSSVSLIEDSDPAWSPVSLQSPVVKKRHYYKRPQEAKRRLAGVEKKERKKRQNVEAARRYRDKKKNEQYFMDGELDELMERNSKLKQQVQERSLELRTLLKLMKELGMIKSKK